MSTPDTSALLREHLALARAARQRAASHPASATQRARLRTWQAERLARTHADLLAAPRYRDAARFFLSDLYSAGDTSERDRALERALPTMIRLLPATALEPLAYALEADALAESLDAALAQQLFAGDADAAISESSYAAAFRACGNREERERQLTLVDRVGRQLDRIAHKPLLASTVRLMRQPAAAAGFGTLQNFLERGLGAFKAMGGAGEFLDLVLRRERTILARLFDAHPAPFALAD